MFLGSVLMQEKSRPKPPPRRKKKAASTAPTGQPSPTAPRATQEDLYDVDDLDDDDFKPVDVDVNVVKNLLGAYSAQPGSANPAASILGGMGVRVPRDDSLV